MLTTKRFLFFLTVLTTSLSTMAQTWDYRYEFLGWNTYQNSTSNSLSEASGDYYAIANDQGWPPPSHKFFGILQTDLSGVAATGKTFAYGDIVNEMEGNAIHSDALHSYVVGYYEDAGSMLIMKRDNSTGAVIGSKGVYINDISQEYGTDLVKISNGFVRYMAVGQTSPSNGISYPMIVTFDTGLGLHQVAYYPQTRVGTHVVTQGILTSQGDVMLVGAFRPTGANGQHTGPGELFTMKISTVGVAIGGIKYYPIQGTSCVHPSITEIGTKDEYLVAFGDGSTNLFAAHLDASRVAMWAQQYDMSLGMNYARPMQIMDWASGDITISFGGARLSGNNVTGLLELDGVGGLVPGSEWYDSPVAQTQIGCASIQGSNGGVLLATTGTLSGQPGNIQLISERQSLSSTCESAIGPVLDNGINLVDVDFTYTRGTFANEMPVNIMADLGYGQRFECTSTTPTASNGTFKKNPTSVEGAVSNSLSISPSIGSGVFEVLNIPSDVLSIDVLNLNGQVVTSVAVQGALAHINLSTYEQGVYLVKVQGANGSDVLRIVKQ